MARGTLLRLRDSHIFSKDSSYKRNNKSTGQKNVRCFTPCFEGGHKLKQVRDWNREGRMKSLDVASAAQLAR